MTLPQKHNKAITIAGEVVKTLITYAIYLVILSGVAVGLLYWGTLLGGWIHNIFS